MKRGDAVVFSISAVLTASVIAAVAFSVLVLDRKPSNAVVSGSSVSSLLALTWGPSLCKVEPTNPGCRSGHVAKMGQSFVLHGLWPQPSSEQYCDVPKRAADRPALSLPGDVQTGLQDLMSDASVMASHEWYAHGTCSGVAAPEYFAIATSLTEQVRKVLDPLFDQADGRRLAPRTVREAFDAEFGRGAGNRVGLTCRDVSRQGTVVYEVHLSLPPVTDLQAGKTGPSLAEALPKGPTIPAGCGQGRVP